MHHITCIPFPGWVSTCFSSYFTQILLSHHFLSCAGGSRTTDNFGGDPGVSGVSPTTMSPSGVSLASNNIVVPRKPMRLVQNAIMALIQWVEHGAAPNTITATGNSGISRPLCPYPKVL
jgi:hypothetical protein